MAAVRFCSACSAPLPSAPPVPCDACGTSHWRNPKPCANGIVVADGAVLLVRRAYAESPWHGSWCAPGGFCETGEHPIQTVEREVHEETGLRVKTTGYIGVWVDAYADAPAAEDAEVINVAYYHATLVGSGGRPDPAEVSAVEWFPWDDLPGALAPPATLEKVLAAARIAHARGAVETPLPDLPV